MGVKLLYSDPYKQLIKDFLMIEVIESLIKFNLDEFKNQISKIPVHFHFHLLDITVYFKVLYYCDKYHYLQEIYLILKADKIILLKFFLIKINNLTHFFFLYISNN